MSAATLTFDLDDALQSLSGVVAAGAPSVDSPKHAVDLIASVERARRLAAVAAVDVMNQIDADNRYQAHGHANARTMFAYIAHGSRADSARLDRIRRMVSASPVIEAAWRSADLSVDKAALLGRAWANPRTQDQFVADQGWLLEQAQRFGVRRLRTVIGRWLDVHDADGPAPAPDPSYQRRKALLAQDHFTKTWKLDAELGSMQGSAFNETFRSYVQAEFDADWAAAEKIHGADTCQKLLGRTDAQRCADALCQMAADAANSDKPSAPVKRVHNIVWNAGTYEELLRRWASNPAAPLDPGSYNISDVDGNPIEAGAAFADSLVSSFRRIVQNAAGVTINMGTEARLFVGLARLGVSLSTRECYWPGCHIPTSRCQIDHLRPAARGGPTDQLNGLPACKRHNRLKERGYVVTRCPSTGKITITDPIGQELP